MLVLLTALSLAMAGRALGEANTTNRSSANQRVEIVTTPSAERQHSLTLNDLEAIATANQPSLRLAAARVAAARGRWIQAGLLPNPTTGYMGSQIGDSDTAGQQGGFISQELVTAHKLQLNRAAASQEIRALEREMFAQRLRVLTDVRLQYFEVLAAQNLMEISQELAGIGTKGLDAAESLFRGQEVGQTDVLQARIERNSSNLARQISQNRYRAAWRRLAAVVGMPELQPTNLHGQLDFASPEIRWDDAMGRLLASSPELAAAQSRFARATWLLERARVQAVPNVQAMVSAQHDNASGDDIANAQVGVAVPVFNRNQGGIREAQAQVVAARADVARAQLAIQERLAQEFRQYSNARQQVDIYRVSILPDAQANLDLAAKAYRAGVVPFLNQLTAQRTFSQVKIAYLESLLSLRRSEVMIEGLLLSNSLTERSEMAGNIAVDNRN